MTSKEKLLVKYRAAVDPPIKNIPSMQRLKLYFNRLMEISNADKPIQNVDAEVNRPRSEYRIDNASRNVSDSGPIDDKLGRRFRPTETTQNVYAVADQTEVLAEIID